MSNFNLFPIKSDKLTDASAKAIESFPNKVVVTGARLVMDNRTGKKESIEFEFLQQRLIEGRSLNILSLLHAGDDRWSAGVTKMRVWTTVTTEGAIDTLGFPKELVDAIVEGCSKLADDERLAIMRPIEFIKTPLGNKVIKIVCNETVSIDRLPMAIQRQLETEYADRYKLQAPTGPNNELEAVVDENGNQVYRWFTFGTEENKDLIVANKSSISRYLENMNQTQSSTQNPIGNPIGLVS